MARKRTVEARATANMTLADKLSVVAWEACRAWDSVNGGATKEWTELTAKQREAITVHVQRLLEGLPTDGWEPVLFFPSDRWEEAVRDKIVAGVVRSIAFV